MKILHINTSDAGGAAIACNRLHCALLNKGVDSKVLLLYKYNNLKKHYAFLDHTWSLISKIKFSLLSRRISGQLKNLKKKISDHEMISLPNTPYDITKHPLFREADVIHLHWVSNFLDYESFFRKTQKPIVWTLHDMNPFSGLFHYENDRRKNVPYLPEYEATIQSKKLEALSDNDNITFITLSSWMNSLLDQAPFKMPISYKCIPNGLDTNVFAVKSQIVARSYFGIPPELKIILFVAGDIDNERKGFKYLLQAIEGLRNTKTILYTMGIHSQLPEDVVSLGKLDSDEEISMAYSCADIFALPSLEDNLPNTVIEAMAHNLPVVAFDKGGLSDMIDSGGNGELVKLLDIDEFTEKIALILNNNEYRQKLGIQAREKVLKHFNIKNCVDNHLNLYNSLIL